MPMAEAGELLVSDTRVVNYHTQEVAIVAHHVSNSHSKRICTVPQQGPFFQALRFVRQPCSVLGAELHHVGRYTFLTSLHPDSVRCLTERDKQSFSRQRYCCGDASPY